MTKIFSILVDYAQTKIENRRVFESSLQELRIYKKRRAIEKLREYALQNSLVS